MKLTKKFREYLLLNKPDLFVQIALGRVETISAAVWQDYLEWERKEKKK